MGGACRHERGIAMNHDDACRLVAKLEEVQRELDFLQNPVRDEIAALRETINAKVAELPETTQIAALESELSTIAQSVADEHGELAELQDMAKNAVIAVGATIKGQDMMVVYRRGSITLDAEGYARCKDVFSIDYLMAHFKVGKDSAAIRAAKGG